MREIGVNWIMGACDDFAEQAAIMKACGFTATFVQLENDRIGEIFSACRKVGIRFHYLHAPYGKDANGVSINDMWNAPDSEAGTAMLTRLSDSLELCAKYEAPIMIQHVSSAIQKPPVVNPYGIERFGKLLERAKALGITIAFENQRSVANLAAIFEEFPDAKFCWDTGHEYAFGGGIEFMPAFGHRIAAVHLQDNTKQALNDQHLIPGDGLIDFSRVADYLAKFSYNGPLIMELKKHPNPEYKDMPAEEYFKRAADKIRKIFA